MPRATWSCGDRGQWAPLAYLTPRASYPVRSPLPAHSCLLRPPEARVHEAPQKGGCSSRPSSEERVSAYRGRGRGRASGQQRSDALGQGRGTGCDTRPVVYCRGDLCGPPLILRTPRCGCKQGCLSPHLPWGEQRFASPRSPRSRGDRNCSVGGPRADPPPRGAPTPPAPSHRRVLSCNPRQGQRPLDPPPPTG